jgi:single-stranded DNA-specific DHH superfamily exonuclease
VFDQPWGAEFSSPLFDGVFQLISQYVVGGKHLNVRLLHTNIFFTKKDSKTLAHIKKKRCNFLI